MQVDVKLLLGTVTNIVWFILGADSKNNMYGNVLRLIGYVFMSRPTEINGI